MLGLRPGRRLVSLSSLQPFLALGETDAPMAGPLRMLWPGCIMPDFRDQPPVCLNNGRLFTSAGGFDNGLHSLPRDTGGCCQVSDRREPSLLRDQQCFICLVMLIIRRKVQSRPKCCAIAAPGLGVFSCSMARQLTAATATAVTSTAQRGIGSDGPLHTFILSGRNTVPASLYQLL